MGRFLLVSFLLILSKESHASSCCGQLPASFPILQLSQRLSINTSYSMADSQGRVFNSKDFYVWNDKKREIHSFGLNIAGAMADRHQAFISTSLFEGRYRDSTESGASQNMSDTLIGYSYELLPEYSFSYWKPVVYLSTFVNLPTGKSIYDTSSLSEGADVTGHNQWGFGMGLTLKKVYFPLTLLAQAKSLKIFSKSFGGMRVSDFYDNSLSVTANYALNFQEITLSAGVSVNHLTPRTLSTIREKSGSLQSTTVLLGSQKNFGENWGVGLFYSDQTWLGRARNTVLNKTYSLNVNYNYF